MLRTIRSPDDLLRDIFMILKVNPNETFHS